MSLIQDALKRQQEEAEPNRSGQKDAPVRDAEADADKPAASIPLAMPVPPSPKPAPVPADQPKRGKSEKSWKLAVGIIMLWVIIIGGGLWVVIVMKQPAERLWHTLISSLPAGRLGMSGKASARGSAFPAATTPHPAVAPLPAYTSWISRAAAAAPAFADPDEDLQENAPALSAAETEESLAMSAPMPVVWPKLKLTAVFSNLGSGRAGARLNNRLVLLGDQIEGVTVVDIRHDSVMLKFNEEVRFLKMGATLN